MEDNIQNVIMIKFAHKRSLGQNFLKNVAVVDKIMEAAQITIDDVIIEIGPGQGMLTQALVQSAQKVITIELDERLISQLAERFEKYDNIEIIHGDILHMNIPELLMQYNIDRYKVVANIPYYITAPIIRLFLENSSAPTEIVLMVQKEVAERLVAMPGAMSVLAVSAQYYADISYVFTVARDEFDPVPQVDSAVVKLVANNKHNPNSQETKSFFRTVKIGFSARRKTLLNNIANGYHKEKNDIEKILTACHISPQSRAQELTLENWQDLSHILEKK